jgi:hypothetical protein
MLVKEQRRIQEADPDAMVAALAPFTKLLEGLLADAGVAGAVRAGDWSRDATTMFDLVLHQIYLLGSGADRAAADEAAEYMWDFCWSGLSGGGR